jgi:predicted ATPase
LLATRFGQDVRVAILSYRSLALWVLGNPEAAIADTDSAIKEARDIGQAATLMYALTVACLTLIQCGSYETVAKDLDEMLALADEKAGSFWKAYGMSIRGCTFALTGDAAGAVKTITSGIIAWRSTGTTLWIPFFLSSLAKAHAELDQFDAAWRSVDEALTAIETTKETLYEPEVHRIAGEIALLSPERDAAKAEAFLEHALNVARDQQAKSWELRAAMSMARLWRDQGKQQQALELLAPVYGWFTEGFDTRDLKDAKALLEELQRA